MLPRSISASDLIAHSMNRVIRSRISGSTSCSDFMSPHQTFPSSVMHTLTPFLQSMAMGNHIIRSFLVLKLCLMLIEMQGQRKQRLRLYRSCKERSPQSIQRQSAMPYRSVKGTRWDKDERRWCGWHYPPSKTRTLDAFSS